MSTKRTSKASEKRSGKKSSKVSTKKRATAPDTSPAVGLPARTKRNPVRYWLMKSEPEAYSVQDLEREGRADWDGVRNYQARNFMRDEMAIGDEVFFYHSNSNPSGIAGRARVSRAAAPDVTALDPDSKYFDPKATQDEPRWYCVELEHVETFPQTIPLATLKQTKGLESMEVVKRGQRLSIMPVTKAEFDIVCRLAAQGTR